MKYNDKIVRVMLVGNAKEYYEKLSKNVEEEKAKRVVSSPNQSFLRTIQKKIGILKQDPEYGVHIGRNKIPKEYRFKYDLSNLWKVNLSGGWRMIYSLKGSEVELMIIILDIFNHKTCNNKFGYKNK